MNIAWYTPYSNESAIGQFSCGVVSSLRDRGATIQIIRSESKTPILCDTVAADPTEAYVWAKDIEHDLANQLRQFDLVVYNVGDRYDDHIRSFQHQSLVAGVTLLHDSCLHHALLNHCRRTLRATHHYREVLEAECGPNAAEAYDLSLQSKSQQGWWHDQVSRFPVYRWALQNTLGVVTHAEYYRDAVATTIGCPTITIPLAYRMPTSAETVPRRSQQRKLTIVAIGAANSNKRHQTIIRALASSSQLIESFRYRIVGAADTAQKQVIETTVMMCPRTPEVSLTGHSTRDMVGHEIANADIVAFLHQPAMEGSNASVVEALLSGKPLILSDTACSSDVPDSLALKVSLDGEQTQVIDYLTQIARDYPSALSRAEGARQWAQPRHAPEAYAARFLEFAERVLYNRPVLQVADHIAEYLREWDWQIDATVLQRLDSAMHDLFGTNDERRRAA